MKFFGKYSRLNNEEQAIRLAIINWGIDHGGEIPWTEAIALSKQYAPDFPEALLLHLEEQRYFTRTPNGDICYIYPYSAYPTDYLVTLSDGRKFYAMCAIDAMGCAVTFHQQIQIQSCCKDSGETIDMTLDPSGILSINPDDKIYATYYDTSTHYVEFNC